MKYFIFNCKQNKIRPTVDDFFYKLKFAIAVEKHNSLTNKNRRKQTVSYNNFFYAFSGCSTLFLSEDINLDGELIV